MNDPRIERLRFLANFIATARGNEHYTRAERIASEFNMRIPAEPHRDADLVLSWAADEIERLTRENERLREAVSNALDDVLSDEAMPAHKVALLRAALSGGEHE